VPGYDHPVPPGQSHSWLRSSVPPGAKAIRGYDHPVPPGTKAIPGYDHAVPPGQKLRSPSGDKSHSPIEGPRIKSTLTPLTLKRNQGREEKASWRTESVLDSESRFLYFLVMIPSVGTSGFQSTVWRGTFYRIPNSKTTGGGRARLPNIFCSGFFYGVARLRAE
jgi:hypothetical protein